jgi:hypothetical protein
LEILFSSSAQVRKFRNPVIFDTVVSNQNLVIIKNMHRGADYFDTEGLIPRLLMAVFPFLLGGCGMFYSTAENLGGSTLTGECADFAGFYLVSGCQEKSAEGTSYIASLLIETDCTTTITNTIYLGSSCVPTNIDNRDRSRLTLSNWGNLSSGSPVQITVQSKELTQLSSGRKSNANSNSWYGLADWIMGEARDISGLDPGPSITAPVISAGDALHSYLQFTSGAEPSISLSTEVYSSADLVPASPSASDLLNFQRLIGISDCSSIEGTYRIGCHQRGTSPDYVINERQIGANCQVDSRDVYFSDSNCATEFKRENATCFIGDWGSVASFTDPAGVSAPVVFTKYSTLYKAADQVSTANSDSHFGFNDWVLNVEKETTGTEPGAGLSSVSERSEGELVSNVPIRLDTSTSPDQLHLNGEILDKVE